jgi:hypothetical protein
MGWEEQRIDYFQAAQQKQGVVILLSEGLSVDKKHHGPAFGIMIAGTLLPYSSMRNQFEMKDQFLKIELNRHDMK